MYTTILMQLVLVLIVFWLLRILLRANRDQKSNINLEDLLLDSVTGKLSKPAAVLMGAYMVSTWMMVYMTVNKTMTGEIFIAYLGAFVAPIITKIIVERAPSSDQNAGPGGTAITADTVNINKADPPPKEK